MPTFTYKLPSATANTNMFMDKLEAKDKQTSENDTFNYDPNTSTVTVTTGVDINFDQTFINLYSTLWAGIKDNTGKHTYLTSKNGGNILDKDAIDSALRAGGANLSGLADAFKSAEYYVSHPSEYSEKEIAEKPKKEKKPKVEDETPRPPKPERERNHPLRDALAKLRAGKTEEPTTPVTGKLIDDYEGFKVKADRHLTNTSTRIDNMLGAMERCVGLADVSGLTSQQITTLLLQAEGALNIDKVGLKSWRDGLQNVINQIPNPTSLSAEQLTGGSETSRNKKIEEIKKGYADYKAKMEAKIEKADKVLALTEKVLKLEVKDFKTQLPGLRAELRNLQNPATPPPTGEDDEEVVATDLDDAPLTRAERRAAERKQKEDESRRAEEARLAAEDAGAGTPDTENPLAKWASDPVVGPVVATFGKQKQNMTENERGPIKLIKSAQEEFTEKLRAGDFTVEEDLPEDEWSARQTEVAKAIEDEKQALLEVVNGVTSLTNQLQRTKASASTAAQAAIDGASGEKAASYAEFKTKIEEAYDGLIYSINKAKNDIGLPAIGENNATGLFLTLDTLADNAVKVSAGRTSTPPPPPRTTRGPGVGAAAESLTTLTLIPDKSNYTAGETVTVTFTLNPKIEPGDLDLSISLLGRPFTPLPPITPHAYNQFQVQFKIPDDTKDGELKISLSNTEQTVTGLVKIQVKAKAADATTPSAPTEKTIGSLEITAKPSRAKPGQTVELTIKAWGTDNKKLEGAKGDLVVRAKLEGDAYNLSTNVTEAGNGKYKVSYTIPGDAEGNITFQASSKANPSIKKTTQVNLITTTASEPAEKPEETPGRLEVAVTLETVEPGQTFPITFILKNKANSQEKMGGYALGITVGTTTISPSQIIDNQDGTYTINYTVPNNAKDDSTLVISGNIPTINGFVPATATLKVSLPTPTTPPDQFLGLRYSTGFTPPTNTKLPPLTKALFAEIKAYWPKESNYTNRHNSALEPLGKEANTLYSAATAAQVIAQKIWYSTEIDEVTKKAYLTQLAAELKALSTYANNQQRELSALTDNSSYSFTVDKMKIWATLESVIKVAIPEANDEIFSHTKKGYTKPASPITKSNIDLLKENIEDPTVARFLELSLAFSAKTRSLSILKNEVSKLNTDLAQNGSSILTQVSSSDKDAIILALKAETKKLLGAINTKISNNSGGNNNKGSSQEPDPKNNQGSYLDDLE